jgi:hypothetical protein
MLYGDISRESFCRRGFMGNTYHNLAEKPVITKFFDVEATNIQDILNSMFDFAATRGETWTRKDWLCIKCIYFFFDRHKMDWWLDHKRSCL